MKKLNPMKKALRQSKFLPYFWLPASRISLAMPNQVSHDEPNLLSTAQPPALRNVFPHHFPPRHVPQLHGATEAFGVCRWHRAVSLFVVALVGASLGIAHQHHDIRGCKSLPRGRRLPTLPGKIDHRTWKERTPGEEELPIRKPCFSQTL